MQDVAYAVVDEFAAGEGVVAALVGEDPVAGEDGAHPEGVQVPADEPGDEVEGHDGGHAGRKELVGEVNTEDSPSSVAEHEVHGVDGRALKALLGLTTTTTTTTS